MNKTFLNLAFAAVVSIMTSSCIDKNVFADEDAKPSWLGESIYKELQNPSDRAGLKGSFKYYLRLVDDLGYRETLSRTGSKTVFRLMMKLSRNSLPLARGKEWNVTKI